MPQMSPLYWLLMFFVNLIILVLLNLMIYFLMVKFDKFNNFKKKNLENKMIMKW